MTAVKYLLQLVLLIPTAFASAQSYTDSMVKYRQKYVAELVAESNGPVKPSQVKNFQFFAPDPRYRTVASFEPTIGAQPFKVQTHSGKQKPFKEYGIITFTLNELPGATAETLHVYQSVNLINNEAHKNDLFIPFNDRTNYELTYAGGRYIDLTIDDIVNGKVTIDFNKCYNPYCAYADGWSCPIPPKENNLPIEIKAGEKMFIH